MDHLLPRAGQPAGDGLGSQDRLELWIDQLLRRRISLVVWTTAEGVAEILRYAARDGRDWPLIRALRHCGNVSLGVGTARTLTRLGLPPRIAVAEPSPDRLIHAMRRLAVRRQPLALQHDGGPIGRALTQRLHDLEAVLAIAAPCGGAPPTVRRGA